MLRETALPRTVDVTVIAMVSLRNRSCASNSVPD